MAVSVATHANYPSVRTGTRLVKIDMKENNAIPNFMRISGHPVTMDYRGLKRVCSRCWREGYFKAQCQEPFCELCGIFGHATEGCSSNYNLSGRAHAPTSSTILQRYFAVTRVALTKIPDPPTHSVTPVMAPRSVAQKAPPGPSPCSDGGNDLPATSDSRKVPKTETMDDAV